MPRLNVGDYDESSRNRRNRSQNRLGCNQDGPAWPQIRKRSSKGGKQEVWDDTHSSGQPDPQRRTGKVQDKPRNGRRADVDGDVLEMPPRNNRRNAAIRRT